MAEAKRKTGRNIFLTIAALLLIAGGGWGYFRHRQQGVITVQTDRVARRSLTETVVANGRIQPVLQVKISPEVSGEIIELPFKEGQPVKKGELLMRIKPDTYIANRNSAEASYRAALAGKDLAEATLKKAEVEAKRNQELLDNHLISVRRAPGSGGQGGAGARGGGPGQDDDCLAAHRHRQQTKLATRRAGGWHGDDDWHRGHGRVGP